MRSTLGVAGVWIGFEVGSELGSELRSVSRLGDTRPGQGSGQVGAVVRCAAHLEVPMENSDGVQVRKGAGKRSEDFLGKRKIDPLLKQHDREVAVRCGLEGREWGVKGSNAPQTGYRSYRC